MIVACLMILPNVSEPQCRVLVSPTRKDAILHHFAFIWVFHPFLHCFCYRTGTVLKPRPPRRLTKIVCLHSCNQKKLLHADGGEPSGLVRKEPLPLSLSHVRKVWSAGLGIRQGLAVRRGCDVSHFRMDSTMCGMPPSFFLFF